MSDRDLVERWLLAKDWASLERHFAAKTPSTAAEYHARSLMRLKQPADRIDWRGVVADMRQAVDLRPDDVVLRVNLIQALLDCHLPWEALEQARLTYRMAPQSSAIVERYLTAAMAVQQWDEALELVLRFQERVTAGDPIAASLARFADELRSRWWLPIAAGGIVLRMPDGSDAGFLERSFQDQVFMRRYHRFQKGDVAAVASFISVSRLSPRRSRRLDWIVVDRAGTRLGLAALVEIDWDNARAELLVGFPGQWVNMAALKASVAVLAFAFHRLRLQKIVSHVYRDNAQAQSDTLHLGFREEGLLRSHIADGEGRLDLHLNAMLRDEYLGNPLLAGLTRRWTRFV